MPSSEISARGRKLLILISLAIFFQSVSRLKDPLEIDERATFAAFPQLTFSQVIDPRLPIIDFADASHHLVIPASYLAYRLFGMNEIALRAPSIVFLVLFLWLLIQWGPLLFGFRGTLLILLNAYANWAFVWYSHSARGYMSAIFFTTYLFLLTEKHLRPRAALITPIQTAGILLVSIAAVLSHGMSGIFVYLLAGGIGVWAWMNASDIEPIQEVNARSILKGVLPSLVLVPLIALLHAHGVQGSYFVKDYVWLGWFSVVLGFDRYGIFRLETLFDFTLLYLYWRNRPRNVPFIAVFVPLSALFLFLFLSVLRPNDVAVRFFLVFLIPYILWISECMRTITPSGLRYGLTTVALGLLCVLPLSEKKEVLSGINERCAPYDRFIAEVRKQSANWNHPCFSASGSLRDVNWARNIYFAKEMSATTHCSQKVHLDFGSGSDSCQFISGPNLPHTPPPPGGWLTVYEDAGGRRVLTEPTKMLKINDSPLLQEAHR